MVNVIPLERHLSRCRWPGCHSEPIDTQIPLCDRHFVYIGEIYVNQRTVLGADYLAAQKPEMDARRAEIDSAREQRLELADRRSVVYYVRIGDHVKIGYTSMLPTRISGLRVDRDALMAVEPGAREHEAKRHAQFAEERQGKREDFNPSRRLMAHIDVVRSKYGEPYEYARRHAEMARSA